MTDSVIINKYSCGIVTSEELDISQLEQAREELSKQGFITWITHCPSEDNQESHSA